jgi:hypothetical protein
MSWLRDRHRGQPSQRARLTVSTTGGLTAVQSGGAAAVASGSGGITSSAVVAAPSEAP